MPEPRPIDRLRQVRDAARAGRPLPPDAAEWLAERLDRYEDQAPSGLDLDAAFGLAQRGGSAWWHEEARRQRDATIRALRDQYFADAPLDAAVKAIHLLATRYQAASARRDAAKAEADLVADGRRRLIAAALRTGRTFPGQKQLRAILGNPIPD